MKMPDPTMPPITSIVAPKGPISRASAGGPGGVLTMTSADSTTDGVGS